MEKPHEHIFIDEWRVRNFIGGNGSGLWWCNCGESCRGWDEFPPRERKYSLWCGWISLAESYRKTWCWGTALSDTAQKCAFYLVYYDIAECRYRVDYNNYFAKCICTVNMFSYLHALDSVCWIISLVSNDVLCWIYFTRCACEPITWFGFELILRWRFDSDRNVHGFVNALWVFGFVFKVLWKWERK